MVQIVILSVSTVPVGTLVLHSLLPAISSGRHNINIAGSMSVKVFGAPMSAGSVGCAMLARDIGVGDLVLCDVSKGDQMKPEFLAMNPFHHIPALEDGNVKIGEAAAILRYLGAKYKQQYYPTNSDPATAARIDFALEAFTGDVVPQHMQTVFVVFGFTPKKNSEDEQKAANQKYTDIATVWADTFLSGGKKFVGGNQLTIADFRAVPFFYAAVQPGCEKMIGLVMPARIKKYVEDFMAATKASDMMSNQWGCSLKEFTASKLEAFYAEKQGSGEAPRLMPGGKIPVMPVGTPMMHGPTGREFMGLFVLVDPLQVRLATDRLPCC